MIADTQGVGHDRQRRIHRAARREEAAVDDVEVVDLVRLAVDVERRRLRVASEANRAVLVRHARQGNALAEKEIAPEQTLMALVAVHTALALPLHQALQRADELVVPL